MTQLINQLEQLASNELTENAAQGIALAWIVLGLACALIPLV